jgi:hypothetical protein
VELWKRLPGGRLDPNSIAFQGGYGLLRLSKAVKEGAAVHLIELQAMPTSAMNSYFI